MKKIAIVGLGRVGMPLAFSLLERGYSVVGSKTHQDSVEAARMSGMECYLLHLTPELRCATEELALLLTADVLVITLPATQQPGEDLNYLYSVQALVDSALVYAISRIIFLSSTSVYGDRRGRVDEYSQLAPDTPIGRRLAELEKWLYGLPNTSVDILRLAGLVGAGRHPGRFLAGQVNVTGADHKVNLVHQNDVISAICLLLEQPQGGHLYNLCAPFHPTRQVFYPPLACSLGLRPPQFKTEKADEGKWVDASLITSQLGFIYQYPDPVSMPWN